MAWQSTHASLIDRLGDPSDQEAWARFDRSYGPLITNYCRACGLQLSDAEDVRQMVMAGLASAMPAFTYDAQRGRFRSYLARAVRHAMIRLGSRNARGVRSLDAGSLEGGAGAPIALEDAAAAAEDDARWEREWHKHHLRRAFRTLAGDLRPDTVRIFRRLLDGAEPAVLAAEEGCSVAAIYKIRTRVGARLREVVAAQLREESCAPLV